MIIIYLDLDYDTTDSFIIKYRNYNFLQEKFKISTYAIFGYKYLEYRFSNNDKD